MVKKVDTSSVKLKKSLEDKIEDELDMKAIKDYENNLENGKDEVFTHDEVKRMLSLNLNINKYYEYFYNTKGN